MGGLIGVAVADDCDHGVAPGGRMVGKEEHRLAVGRDLDCAGDQTFGGKLIPNGSLYGLATQS